jgi:hypothetical protein
MNNHALCPGGVQMSACNILRNILEDMEGDEVETRLHPVSGQDYVQAVLHAM